MLQARVMENLEDEYAKDINMTDSDFEDGSSLVGQESDSDDFYVDEAMDIEPDFADETIAFGFVNQPKITSSSSDSPPALIPASTAVKMLSEPPTPTNKITPAPIQASTAVKISSEMLTPTKEKTSASTAESSEKKTATSAIHEGLSMVKNTQQCRGLFKYFKECSREQYLADVARETEKCQVMVDQQAYAVEEANQIRKVNLRKRAQERKQKSRKLKKNREIQMGLRSPGGTKRRVCPLTLLPYNPGLRIPKVVAMKLANDSHQKARSSIADLSRPARMLKKKFKEENRKPQGRKRKIPIRSAKYHNWHTPFIWTQIEIAVRQAGWEMGSSAIVAAARKIDPVLFAGLRRTTVNSWIDRSRDRPRWKDSILKKIEQGNDPGHKNGGQKSVVVSSVFEHLTNFVMKMLQDRHPEVVDAIKKRLLHLQKDGAPLNVITIRGIILATITIMKPSILDVPYRDGSTFKASDDFVRRWVRRHLNWTERKATRAAQKMPHDWEDKCEKSFL
jgi:hypothetical protein